VSEKTRLLVLDRDGVLVKDTGKIRRAEDVKYLPGAIEALGRLPTGWLVVICSNQAAVGRGDMTENDLLCITTMMKTDLLKVGVKIAKFYFCMHRPEDECECRKPKPHMVLSALKDFNIRPENAWGVGDKDSDIAAFRAAGIHAVRVLDSNSPMTYDVTDEGDEFNVVGSLYKAVDLILERQDLTEKTSSEIEGDVLKRVKKLEEDYP
jgi:D-glycero-D-manno-heptose 1,7-bisphosphate phosphatase